MNTLENHNKRFEKERFFLWNKYNNTDNFDINSTIKGWQGFGILRRIVWLAIMYWVFAGSIVMGEDLVIDLFQYSSQTEAQAAWAKTLAALPCEPVTEGGVSCLKLPSNISPTNIGARWDRTVNLDLSSYDRIVLRLKSTHIFTQVGLYFFTAAGGYYQTYQHASEQWHTYTFPISSFAGIGNVNGWDNIIGIRIAAWWEISNPTQEDDLTSPDLFVSNLRASNNYNNNFIINSAFEVTTSETMPDYWGPSSSSWGTAFEQWVLDTDSWREYWGVDRTSNHTPGGTNSLRIETTTSPVIPELQAVSNWITLIGNEDYTFSVWLKSDTPSLPVVLQVTGCNPASITTSSTPNTWNRYTLSVTPTSTSSSVSCSIYPTTAGTLWIDDVQLELGTTATNWQESFLDAEIPTQTVHKDVPEILDCVVTSGGDSVTVNIDSNGHFLVDNEPFIPISIGWYGLPSNNVMQHLAEAGFNTIAPYLTDSSALTINILRAFLDNAKANGLKVIIWVNNDVPITVLEGWINGLKDKPAIIMWYVYDEPLGIYCTSDDWLKAKAKYDLAREKDPSRPVMINRLAQIGFESDWFSDILCTDYYAVAFRDNSIGRFNNIIRTLGLTAATATYKKPAWCWIQSGGYSFYCYREPTGAEAECMAYLALVHGSRGFMYFFQKPRTAEQWKEVRILNNEIHQLRPMLYSLDTAPTITTNSPSIRILCKRYKGKNYVIAVNESPLPVNAELTLSEGVTTLGTVLFEDRTINVVDGEITDIFAGYQRHVYCVDSFQLYLAFDENAGASMAFDSSGNCNDGTLVNMDPQNDWGAGMIGNALDFDGVNDYVDCGNPSSLNLTEDLTLAFWVNPNNIGTQVLNPLDKSYAGEFALTVWQHGGLSYFHHSAVTPGYWPAYSIVNIQNDIWQHVAITRNTTNRVLKFYYNGELVQTIDYPQEAVPAVSTNSLKIGKGYSGALGGQMDDVRIYDRALTQEEVGELANH